MATTPESFVMRSTRRSASKRRSGLPTPRGVVLLGKFVPSAEAASVSKALHFKHEVEVTLSEMDLTSCKIARREVNRFTYPTPILPREIALKDKPASPRDDQGVNIALGPVLKKPVEFGKSGAIETHPPRE